MTFESGGGTRRSHIRLIARGPGMLAVLMASAASAQSPQSVAADVAITPLPPSVAAASAEAPAHPEHVKEDPYEKTNRSFFKGQDKVDRAVFRPVALGYKHVVPSFLRSAIRNLLHELRLPVIFLNDVLQLRPKVAIKTLERFVINTTVGVGGVIDVAKKAHLPYRKNGFANTLGRYGVGPGPYLYLPLIGPTTLRDLLGGGVDGVVPPTTIGFPYTRLDYRLSTAVTSTLDTRAEVDGEMKALLDGAVDPYATLRSVYLQNRAAEIDEIRGRRAAEQPLVDPLADPAQVPSTTPDSGAAKQPAVQDKAETKPDPIESPKTGDVPTPTDTSSPAKPNS